MKPTSPVPRQACRPFRGTAAVVASLLITVLPPARADWPPLPEVVRRLQSEHAGIPDPAPGATNVLAFLEGLAPQILLPAASITVPGDEAGAPLKTAVYDAGGTTAGYLRLGRIDSKTRGQLEVALKNLQQTHTLVGMVLDLRQASGADLGAGLEAAGALAHRPLQGVRLADRDVSVDPTPRAQPLPVMVLVNRGTRGAAEVLAAALRRSASPSLVVGSPTAGQARMYRELNLAPDARLLVGGSPVVLPGGTNALATGGLVPDLPVTLEPSDEQAYLTNEFVRVNQGRPAIAPGSIRLNEAELVRRRGGGAGGGLRPPHAVPDESSASGRRLGRPRSEEPTPASPSVQDPVLARALDVLAGLVAEQTPPEARADSR